LLLRWVLDLEEEMFRQGDLEKERGHAVSPLMDRAKAGITKSQPGVSPVAPMQALEVGNILV
jgi:hypothetical protein